VKPSEKGTGLPNGSEKSEMESSMRIAQVAPLYERVPPHCYGGTERVVSYLTEELIDQGHEVTLFASGDSVTKAKLISPCVQSLRFNPHCLDYLAYNFVQLEQVFQRAHLFDVIHFHIDYFHFPFSRRQDVPHLTTLHGRLDIPDLVPLYREFHEMPVVSISSVQRAPLAWVNWYGTVYHGLPSDLYEPRKEPGRYLVFLGRISPEKRVDRAIEIAKLAQMPLKIAAKVDAVDRCYMEKEIRPLLNHPLVEFIGEISDADKGLLLKNAYALLFPIDWSEPFGLVMIEAMACGTPTVAFRRGSVPEVLDNGVTGWIVDDVAQAAEALTRLRRFDRVRCRRVFEKRFSARRMAQDYAEIYRRVIEDTSHCRSRPTRKNGVSDSACAVDEVNGEVLATAAVTLPINFR
jgi:glycosyltransferase involved in cell wall biosynthesis